MSNFDLNFFFSSRVTKMPGHVAKTVGPDPSPDQWLYVSDELKVKLKSKPYDPKKSCWVPEKGTGGYLEGLIESVDGEKVSVKLIESKDVSKFYLDWEVHAVLWSFNYICHQILIFWAIKNSLNQKLSILKNNFPDQIPTFDPYPIVVHLTKMCRAVWNYQKKI